MGVPVAIKETPNEVPDPIRFSQDRTHAAYDAAAAHRFWRALVQADRIFKLFRTGFIGKASPVHFFWGSFDLAVTRFSGRPAPPHPGGVPGLPDDVAREAYSHEVSSAGFWPGTRPFRARLSTPTPIPNRLAFATGRSAQAPRSIRRWGNSSCPMTRSRKHATRTPCCSTSCRRPMRPQPTPQAGTAQLWNARLAFQDGSAPSPAGERPRVGGARPRPAAPQSRRASPSLGHLCFSYTQAPKSLSNAYASRPMFSVA